MRITRAYMTLLLFLMGLGFPTVLKANFWDEEEANPTSMPLAWSTTENLSASTFDEQLWQAIDKQNEGKLTEAKIAFLELLHLNPLSEEQEFRVYSCLDELYPDQNEPTFVSSDTRSTTSTEEDCLSDEAFNEMFWKALDKHRQREIQDAQLLYLELLYCNVIAEEEAIRVYPNLIWISCELGHYENSIKYFTQIARMQYISTAYKIKPLHGLIDAHEARLSNTNPFDNYTGIYSQLKELHESLRFLKRYIKITQTKDEINACIRRVKKLRQHYERKILAKKLRRTSLVIDHRMRARKLVQLPRYRRRRN